MNNVRITNLDKGLVPSGEALIELTVSTSVVSTPSLVGDEHLTRYIRFTVETAGVRYRNDGTDPTSAIGVPLAAGEVHTWRRERWLKTKFIRSGGADAKLIGEPLGV